ncbi:hypothetical protein JCM5350_002626 [Sporobolomyces pararoseus]
MSEPSSSSSEEDLPSPTTLFDRLLSSSRATPRQPSSVNKQPLFDSSSLTTFRNSVTPSRNQEHCKERRSSPRLKARREEKEEELFSTGRSTNNLQTLSTAPTRRSTSSLEEQQQQQQQDEVDKKRHLDLANELFPPSPPPSGEGESLTVIGDSEVEQSSSAASSTTNRSKSPTQKKKQASTSSLESQNITPRLSLPNIKGELPSSMRNKNKSSSGSKRRRRITISTISSSDEDEEGEEEGVSRTCSTSTSNDTKNSPSLPHSRRDEKQERQNGGTSSYNSSTSTTREEILIIETDDEEEEQESILPVLEPDFGRDNRDRVGGGGRSGYKGFMQDVWENDGVLIYDPTPKKRPRKLNNNKESTTPDPFKRGSNSIVEKKNQNNSSTLNLSSKSTSTPTPTPTPQTRRRIVEIDLTGTSSSSEDEVENSSSRKPSGKSSSSRNLLFPSSSSTTRNPTASSTFNSSLVPPAPSSSSSSSPTPTPTPKKISTKSTTPAAAKKKKNKSPPLTSSDADDDVMNRKLTKRDREELPLELIRKLDRLVFRKKWKLTNPLDYYNSSDEDGDDDDDVRGLPEGLEIVWNNRLRNTAGRAKWKKVKTTSSPSKVPHLPSTTTTTTTTIRNECTIELSTKVLDTREKLYNTLSHELCHIAVWLLSKEPNGPPHGSNFKLWGQRCMLFGQTKGLKITTTHSYQIDYKFRWKCLRFECGKIFGRHSNSINVETHGCPCGSKLVRIDKDGNIRQPSTPRFVVRENDRGEMVQTPQKKKKSEWLEFVASESPKIRKENKNSTIAQSEVLKLVAERWKLVKQQQQSEGRSKGEGGGRKEVESELERAMEDLRV